MTENGVPLLTEYRDLARDAQTLTFLPRDTELQLEAVENLTEFIQTVNGHQQEAIEQRDEDTANLLLAMRCGCKAVRAELNMWLALKNQDWGTAWSELVDAQDFIQSAQVAHTFTRTKDIQNLREKYNWIETFVFPPQTYLSPGLVVDQFLCSICGDDYQDCEHIAGLPYWGQICSRIIEEATVREVSVVDEPEDKNCRITHFSTDDGMVRSKMTWEKITPDNDSQLASLTEDGNRFTGIVLQPNGVYSQEDIDAFQQTDT